MKDRAEFILKCQTVVEALSDALEAHARLSKARREFEGYSFDYHYRSLIDETEQAAARAGERLADLIDERIAVTQAVTRQEG